MLQRHINKLLHELLEHTWTRTGELPRMTPQPLILTEFSGLNLT